MSIVTAYNLTQTFDQHTIFRGLSAKIEHGDKIGLVGPNGVGKTSLLRILAGIDRPTAGKSFRAGHLRLGYLHQEAVNAFAHREQSVYAEMRTVFATLHALEAKLAHIEAQMATGELSDTLFAEYGDLQATYERQGGYTYETRIEQTLQGLGFAAADWPTPLQHLSGGQQTRALLARLLLDEPTNHLDLPAQEVLQAMLEQYEGTILLISHDRYLVAQLATEIWDLRDGYLMIFDGSYAEFVSSSQKATRGE